MQALQLCRAATKRTNERRSGEGRSCVSQAALAWLLPPPSNGELARRLNEDVMGVLTSRNGQIVTSFRSYHERTVTLVVKSVASSLLLDDYINFRFVPDSIVQLSTGDRNQGYI